ncbi:KTSC domain-containing protein [Chloroflexia bacterium SDU3-3]|nr:KTSC domain-containing protein [Chloroflexia bacterium SDU3-3]
MTVSSSNLASVGYDPTTQTLEICFHSGACYQYFHVPQHVYDGLMGAGSHGTYFDAVNLTKMLG